MSVRNFRPDTPPGLAEAVDRALHKEPADRWQSAAAMKAAMMSGALATA